MLFHISFKLSKGTTYLAPFSTCNILEKVSLIISLSSTSSRILFIWTSRRSCLKMRWQPFERLSFSFSLSCAYLQQHLYQLGEPRRLLQKLEQQEQELAQRRTQEVKQGFEEINVRCDRFYNSFYRRRYICLSGFQVEQSFQLFLSFILLGYILIKSENGTKELCLSLFPIHLTRAFLFVFFITFSILNIFCFAGESSRV